MQTGTPNASHWSMLKKPAGQGDYVVGSGECVSKIAYRKGHFWQTVWDHPDNAELKRERSGPNCLVPGDRLTVPPLEQGGEDCPTEKKHRFRLKGVPAKFRLQLSTGGSPRANEAFELFINGMSVLSSKLDADGRFEIDLPPDANEGMLYVGKMRDVYPLAFGGLDPCDTVTGIKQRLANLGYDLPDRSSTVDDKTKAALAEFQAAQGLEPTGEPDEETLAKLSDVYGS